MPIALGLLAAVLIGASDFFGARSAGRSTALQTTTAAFAGGAAAALVYSPLLGSPTVADLALGAASGAALVVALTTLWQAYAMSSIGVAGPVGSVVSTVIPVAYDAARGNMPGWLGWLGIGVGLASLVLTSWHRDDADARTGLLLGVGSGVFFALMYLIAVASSDDAGTWPIVSQRVTALALAAGFAVATRRRPLAGGTVMGWSAVAGVLGASGVAAVVYAGQRYPLAPAVVTSSMYPAVAIALAWVFMSQPLRGRQVVGLLGALLGVAMMALD